MSEGNKEVPIVFSETLSIFPFKVNSQPGEERIHISSFVFPLLSALLNMTKVKQAFLSDVVFTQTADITALLERSQAELFCLFPYLRKSV